MLNKEEFIKELKKFKNPVIILHPDNKMDFKNINCEVKYHSFVDKDRVYATDKTNMYQFNLDDIEAV